jgi:hypothetical protein
MSCLHLNEKVARFRCKHKQSGVEGLINGLLTNPEKMGTPDNTERRGRTEKTDAVAEAWLQQEHDMTSNRDIELGV